MVENKTYHVISAPVGETALCKGGNRVPGKVAFWYISLVGKLLTFSYSLQNLCIRVHASVDQKSELQWQGSVFPLFPFPSLSFSPNQSSPHSPASCLQRNPPGLGEAAFLRHHVSCLSHPTCLGNAVVILHKAWILSFSYKFGLFAGVFPKTS